MRAAILPVLIIDALLVAACSDTDWVHRYKKPDALVYDYSKCERVVEEEMSKPRSIISPYVANQVLDDCLRKEGWVRKDELNKPQEE